MSLPTHRQIAEITGALVGRPTNLSVLKDKPGRRRTLRARGPQGSVIVKAYASPRGLVVARRLAALATGPTEPRMPLVRHVGHDARLVVLTDLAGTPLSNAIHAGDLATCQRVGAALGHWHTSWWARTPAALRDQTIHHELTCLARQTARAPGAIARLARRLAGQLASPWPCTTVVHRDLYEEQILVDHHIGLIDLDDAASGPPELDLGNLLAHLDLLGHRAGGRPALAAAAIVAGYQTTGPALDPARLHQCQQLSRLRLACIHHEPSLLVRRTASRT